MSTNQDIWAAAACTQQQKHIFTFSEATGGVITAQNNNTAVCTETAGGPREKGNYASHTT
jgi:hypothetical protein